MKYRDWLNRKIGQPFKIIWNGWQAGLEQSAFYYGQMQSYTSRNQANRHCLQKRGMNCRESSDFEKHFSHSG